MIHGHGGNIYAMARQLGCPPADIVDMSSNINPLGMPPGLEAHLKAHLHQIGSLPEVDAGTAIEDMAELLGVDPRRMLAGNGTTQFIYMACPALNARKALIVGPTYADYADACRMYHVEADHFLTRAKDQFEVDLTVLAKQIDGYDTVFICNPNNPTGQLIEHVLLRRLCIEHPQTHFIIDESYLPFAMVEQSRSMSADQPDNVSVLYSLSKIFGIPGLRAGFFLANNATVSRFQHFMEPWSLNSLAQAAVSYLGGKRSEMNAFIDNTRGYLEMERRKFCNEITSRSKLVPFHSQASYILIKLPGGMDAEIVCRRMARKHILIRNCHNFLGLSDRYVRVALKDSKVNQMAVDALVDIWEHTTVPA